MRQTKHLLPLLVAQVRLSALLLIMMVMPAKIWAQSTFSGSGSGTSGDPYKIATAAQLNDLRAVVNAGNATYNAAYYVLTADIENLGAWTPIGNATNPFQGVFNGQGHSIKGMSITGYTTGCQGLFGKTSGATVKNFSIGGTMTSSASNSGGSVEHIGGAIGWAYNSTVEDIASSVNIKLNAGTAQNRVGGVLGALDCSVISGCTYSGTLDAGATGCVAGIVAYTTSDKYINTKPKISNCHNAGTVKTTHTNPSIAGILAYQNTAAFQGACNCLNTGSISAGQGAINIGAIYGYYGQKASDSKNNYYLTGTATKAVGADGGGNTIEYTPVTAEQLASGEVCYLLNGKTSDGNLAWYQKLSATTGDATPVLKKADFTTVYHGYSGCKLTYSNNVLYKWIKDHNFVNGVCTGCGATGLNYVSEVKVSVSTNSCTARDRLFNDGYTLIGENLNKGGGGHYVYVGYKTTNDASKAITGLYIVENNSANSSFDCHSTTYLERSAFTVSGYKHYYRCPNYTDTDEALDCDLNRGRDGKPQIALYYTKASNANDGGTPLTSITLVDNTTTSDVTYTRHWKYDTDLSTLSSADNNDVYGNVNQDGTALYIAYTTHTHSYAASFDWADDGKSCTGKTVCSGCGDHASAECSISNAVKTAATCTIKGTTTYTAIFRQSGLAEQKDTKDVQDIPTIAHDMAKTEYKAPTCIATGNIEYYTCKVCSKVFTDASGKNVTTTAAMQIPATGVHDLTKTEYKAPTCIATGNNEYYTCKVCSKVFTDADGKIVTTTAAMQIPATGHDLDKDKLQNALKGINKTVYDVDKTFTLTFANSYSGTATGISVGTNDGEINLYDDGNGNVVVAPTSAGDVIMAPVSSSLMFFDCSKLNSINFTNFNTENVTQMWGMFYGCSSLTSLDVTGFNTAKVTDMNGMFYGCSSLTSLDLTGFITEKVTDMNGMFNGCSSLTSLDVTGFNTAKVTDMNGMFNGCSSLTSLDVTGFNTEKVENMSEMFRDCNKLTSLDVTGFNTAKVTDMSSMFNGCSGLTSLNLSSFNTSSVTDMNYMFNGCSSLTLLDLSKFNTSNVTNMNYMFNGCSSLTSLNLSKFNTEKVTNMWSMFNGCSSLTTIIVSDRWSMTAVTNSIWMFEDCTNLVGKNGTTFSADHVDGTYARVDGGPESLTPGYFSRGVTLEAWRLKTALQDINTACGEDETFTLTFAKSYSGTATGTSVGTNDGEIYLYNDGNGTVVVAPTSAGDVIMAPENSSQMFLFCSKLNSINFNNFNTDKVTSMWEMFKGCSSLTSLDLRSFNTENVTDMSGMFNGCSSLASLDLTGFITEKVTYMGSMFKECSSLTSLNLTGFNTVGVIAMSNMFDGCSSLTLLDLSKFNTTNVWNMNSMFEGCASLESIAFGDDFNTSKVDCMISMFKGCSSLTSLDVTGFNTVGVIEMSEMFRDCNKLTSLNVTGFNTAKVTDMSSMFNGCSSLTSLDLSKFNTTSVTDINCMFYGCSSLTTIIVGDRWSMTAVTNSIWMFDGCTKLVGQNGTTYNRSNTDATYAHVDANGNPGYLTSRDFITPGDLNADGQITIADLTRLVEILNGRATDTNGKADVDGQNGVTVDDVDALKDKLLGK